LFHWSTGESDCCFKIKTNEVYLRCYCAYLLMNKKSHQIIYIQPPAWPNRRCNHFTPTHWKQHIREIVHVVFSYCYKLRVPFTVVRALWCTIMTTLCFLPGFRFLPSFWVDKLMVLNNNRLGVLIKELLCL